VGKYGGEVVLRKRFEKYLSQQKISFHGRQLALFLFDVFTFCSGHVGKQNIPVVCVIVEGGRNTIRTVLEYVTEEPPVDRLICSSRHSLSVGFCCSH
jgi:transient receptor potential cation channel subfamily M protein 3